MGDLITLGLSEEQKYLKALGKQLGRDINYSELLGCQFFDDSIISMVNILNSTDSKKGHEIILSLLARLLAKALVSADIHETGFEFGAVLRLVDVEYTKAIKEWLDDDFNSLEKE